ncbi:MAG: 3'-5' exonuclease [Cytophagia bacterium]|nr:MAG: 3'-5' exonuclease [Cytophagales bacterium]TAG02869.1 MAG: 3'-5' exonuclease [Cytophagia bacterium]TAG42314.1 MAG: 3'-5' exonuclease [Cytophagia bacterium]TAH29864.1 MAG: 3'-5' exonuclease [Cytophagales bacterium]
MFSRPEISKILFLDIETARCEQYFKQLSPAMQEMWKHKSQFIKSDNEDATPEEKYYERAAIYAEFGRVACISIGFVHFKKNENEIEEQGTIHLKSFCGMDEKYILEDFKNLLNEKFNGWRLCAHNGKEFDFPYLCRRFLINQIALPQTLNIQGKKPWEINHLDTMELWKFGDYKSYTKLELLCNLFNIPTPKDDIDGSEVGTVFWDEKNYERLSLYCEKDVAATIQVLLKFSLLPLAKVKE